MTATSGPGISLMVEAMGLAVASEAPALIINVMRGGPSTGIPTKSEQTDLNQALFDMHGEAPYVVVAPLSISGSVQPSVCQRQCKFWLFCYPIKGLGNHGLLFKENSEDDIFNIVDQL